jgi:molybdopterin-guanine dinucleotide biosynthesis protein B
MIPIVSIVANSETGKTTLLEQLVRELKRRGYCLAVIKHAAGDFQLDREGKDSWRLAQAGSDAMILSSPSKLAILKPVERDITLGEISRLIGQDFDLILTEGFKKSDTPKIEVHRKELGKELLCSPEELFALVTDEKLDLALPQFSWDEVPGLADAIEERFLARKEEEIALFVNGTPVPLSPFVREFMAKTLEGMISALKGIEEVKSLNIWLKK